MATVTNKTKVLSIKGKVKAVSQIEDEKKEADVCWKYGLIYSRNQTIWKNRTKIISVFERTRLRKTILKTLTKRRQFKRCLSVLSNRYVNIVPVSVFSSHYNFRSS